MIVKKFFFPFLLLFLFPLTAQSKIQSGTLNLKSSKFTEKGLIALKGEWTFYWKKFLSPQDLKNKQLLEKGTSFKVPGNWTEKDNGLDYDQSSSMANSVSTTMMNCLVN